MSNPANTLARGVILSLTLLAVSPDVTAAQRDTSAVVRGIVTDSARRGLPDVEVYAPAYGRSTRTGANGAFVLTRLIPGATRLLVRRLGWNVLDTTVAAESSPDREWRLMLVRLPQSLDTVRVSAELECPSKTLEGFTCRRRAAIGVFRDSAELAATRPIFWADMLEGVPGLRRVQVRTRYGHDVRFESLTGWRCLAELFDGRPFRRGDDMLKPADIVGIEFYDTESKVPAWYRLPALRTTVRRTSRASPWEWCAVVVYWTRFATRFDPTLDQSENVTRARQARLKAQARARDSSSTRADSARAKRPPDNQ